MLSCWSSVTDGGKDTIADNTAETDTTLTCTDFAEVGEDFIEDDFNLTGLSQLVPFYKEALEMVLDVEPGELTISCLEHSRIT